ncbi:MAG: DUF2460 domain-containing protein [Leptolyngbyaceae cyanobacterium RM2_2_4]|nr:DUF2460 domain-containing protein [Leptolyngbyaceae cyanobacterium RM2_2_4]
MIESYTSQRLEIGGSPQIAPETTGSPIGFTSNQIDIESGFSYVFPRRNQPKGIYSMPSRNYTQIQWDYLRNFFFERRGRAIAFRWRNWADYQGQDTFVATQGQPFKRIVKNYGNYSKRIWKPIPSSVRLFINGQQIVEGFCVSAEYGLLLFNLQLSQGDVVNYSYEFDTLVRFDQDTIDCTFLGLNRATGTRYYEVGELNLCEVLLDERGLEVQQTAPPAASALTQKICVSNSTAVVLNSNLLSLPKV